MNFRTLAPALALAACSCAPSRPAPPAPARPDAALPVAASGPEAPVPGLDALLTPGAMVLLGELHGTREIPRFAGALAAAFAKRGPTVLALEIPRASGAALEAYLAGGSAADRERALRDPFWGDAYQDGRRSAAMWGLVESARALRAAGAKVEIACFDSDIKLAQEPREQAMADALVAARRAHPGASFVVLVGNLHAAKRTVPFLKHVRWMAARLADAGLSFVSLDARFGEGSAWFCQDGDASHCGPSFRASAHREAIGVRLEPSADGNYDGWFSVGPISASPPAAFPERAAGLEQKLAALAASPGARRARARVAYGAKDFRGCADEIAKIEGATGDDAYTQACCLARAGDRDAAVERVRVALARGLEKPDELERDEDLASLRDHPRWPLKK